MLSGDVSPEPSIHENSPSSIYALLMAQPDQQLEKCSEFLLQGLLPFAYVRPVFCISVEETAAQGPLNCTL